MKEAAYSSSMCMDGVVLKLKWPLDEFQGWIFRIPCGKLAYPCCRDRYLWRWMKHFVWLMSQNGDRAIYGLTTRIDWSVFAKKVKRKSGDYFRVLTNANSAAISTAPLEKEPWGITVEEAVVFVADSLNDIHVSDEKWARPVTTSRTWKLPDRERKDYVLVAASNKPTDHVGLQMARDSGVTVEHCKGGYWLKFPKSGFDEMGAQALLVAL